MTCIGEFVTTCRQVEVQDHAVALPLFDLLMRGDETEGLFEAYELARKHVWRVESYVRGLDLFRPVLRSCLDWADFESEAEARAYFAEMQANLPPMSLSEMLQGLADELSISLREFRYWLRAIVGRFRLSNLDSRLA